MRSRDVASRLGGKAETGSRCAGRHRATSVWTYSAAAAIVLRGVMPGQCSRGDCYSASDRGAEYCDERVCVSVCVRLSTTMCSALHVRSLPAFVDVKLWHLLLMSCHVSDDWASRDCRKTVIQGGPISGATDS